MIKMNLRLFGKMEENASDNPHFLREHSQITLTVPQLMKELNISKNVAYDLTREPNFPCFRLGRKILINRELLQEWLNRRCAPVFQIIASECAEKDG